MENLITNPGAELPATDPLYPLNWGLYIGDAITWTWGRTSPGYLSNNSAYFTILAGRAGSVNMGISPFPCDGYTYTGSTNIFPGQPYYLEFYIKSSFNNVIAVLYYWTQNGSRIQLAITLNEGTVPNTNDIWVKRTATFTSPLDIVSAAIFFKVSSLDGSDAISGMTFYVDDVYFGTDYIPTTCPDSIPCFTYQVNDNVLNTDASCAKGGTVGLEEKPIINYIWDFGDGSLGVGMISQHAYYIGGSYTVKLSTQNDCEQTSQELSTVITVTNPTSSTTSYDLMIGLAVGTIISSLTFIYINAKKK